MGELIFVGLGLGGPEDMSLRALKALEGCDRVFAEFFTSKMIDSSVQDLEKMINKEVTVLTRKDVEEGDAVVEAAKGSKVAFVTAGDPMVATTHIDVRLRATEAGIRTKLIHGASIQTACATAFGLQPYKFGRTVTLPFAEPGYQPSSPYDNILDNRDRGLHTLVLLDIKEQEARYMTAAEGTRWLIEAEQRIGKRLIGNRTLVCAGARIGSETERIIGGYPQDIVSVDLGPPLHALVIPGELHFLEARALVRFAGAPRDILVDE
ncbi:MAG: diphthine synthase [Methanomassiliicoccales archaeon]